MYRQSPELTIYTISPLPILSYTIFKLSGIINIRSRIVQESLSKLSSFSQEVFTGIQIVKSYAIQKNKSLEFDNSKGISVFSGSDDFKSNPHSYTIDSDRPSSSTMKNPFYLLNTSLMNSGLCFEIHENIQIEKPIEIFFNTSEIDDPIMNHPRFHFRLNKNSKATIIDHYSGRTKQSYFINTVSNFELKPLFKNQENIKIIKDAMFSSSNEPGGTSYRSRLEDKRFTFAGKTGSSQISCLLYTSPSPRDRTRSRMPSSA